MECKVDGCDRVAMYQAERVCQMHYFRRMRNGDYNAIGRRDALGHAIPPRDRITTPNGYETIYAKGHPLAHNNRVPEHRYVVYEDIGNVPMVCEICSKALTWKTVHIDHIDNDRSNNARYNLRPLCRVCNTTRGGPKKTTLRFEYEGRMMTCTELSLLPECVVGRAQLKHRLDRGMPVLAALTTEKLTHKTTKAFYKEKIKSAAN